MALGLFCLVFERVGQAFMVLEILLKLTTDLIFVTDS
jgi:hypothetical protein